MTEICKNCKHEEEDHDKEGRCHYDFGDKEGTCTCKKFEAQETDIEIFMKNKESMYKALEAQNHSSSGTFNLSENRELAISGMGIIYREKKVRKFIKLKEELVLQLDEGFITYHEYVEKSFKLAGEELSR